MLEEYYYPEKWERLSIEADDYLEEYTQVSTFLEKKSFNRYEISNFAKP
jgi:coproporphyrinogen III oxidase-like Fe-S oxidoreductase